MFCSSKHGINGFFLFSQNVKTTEKGLNPYYSRTSITPLKVSDAEWQKILSPELFAVARKQGTEKAFTGKYWKVDTKGTYYL
jgi:peptide-methionine (R)-S-oxide reductase